MDGRFPVIQHKRQRARHRPTADTAPTVQEDGVQQISEVPASEAEHISTFGIVWHMLEEIRWRGVAYT